MSKRVLLSLASCAVILAAALAPQPADAGEHCYQHGICVTERACCSHECIFNMASGVAYCTPSGDEP